MNPRRNEFYIDLPLSLQEEFAPCAALRGRSAAGVVARAVCRVHRDIEGLCGRNSAFEPRESTRQVEELFQSLFPLSFGEGLNEMFKS